MRRIFDSNQTKGYIEHFTIYRIQAKLIGRINSKFSVYDLRNRSPSYRLKATFDVNRLESTISIQYQKAKLFKSLVSKSEISKPNALCAWAGETRASGKVYTKTDALLLRTLFSFWWKISKPHALTVRDSMKETFVIKGAPKLATQ